MSNYPPAATPTTYGSSVSNQNQGNGFAVAALILGILPTGMFGLVFGILGLVRAGKVGGKGRVMSWIGIGLTLLWFVGAGTAVALAFRSANLGRLSAEAVADDGSAFVNATDPNALQAQLKSTIANLNAAAAESNNAEATTAIKALASDYQDMLNAVSSGRPPSGTLTYALTADAAAVDKACGHR